MKLSPLMARCYSTNNVHGLSPPNNGANNTPSSHFSGSSKVKIGWYRDIYQTYLTFYTFF